MTERISAKEYKSTKAAKPSKYRNVRTERDGILFDSKKEADRWTYLRTLEMAGEISHLERQPSFKFIIKGDFVKYDSGRTITYKADFAYFDGNHRIIEDVKGLRTREYSIKKACIEAMYPAVKIVEI